MKKSATILGVPMDYGASKAGANAAPAAIRRAGLAEALKVLDFSIEDAGDLTVPPKPARSSPRMRNASAILQVCKELEKRSLAAAKSGAIPVFLGGDHSLAMGTVAGTARAFREKGQKIGLLWVDAHADINTPATSPSGSLHGMPLAHILGMGDRSFAKIGGFSPKVEPRNVCLIGVRDVDSTEAPNLRLSGARVFSMTDVDRMGIARVMEEALQIVTSGTAGFHLSFDIDAVDPSDAPGTGVVKRGGLTYREAHYVMEAAAESGGVRALDLVEVNTLEDIQNKTAALAAELVASALGKRIY